MRLTCRTTRGTLGLLLGEEIHHPVAFGTPLGHFAFRLYSGHAHRIFPRGFSSATCFSISARRATAHSAVRDFLSWFTTSLAAFRSMAAGSFAAGHARKRSRDVRKGRR
jgi:hypothetical protein